MEVPCINDCRALLSDIKKQDKLLRLKRRWVMDLPLSNTEQKRMKKQNFLMDKSIPETLIREDDIYYDKIKLFLERGFGVQNLTEEDNFSRGNLRHRCGSYGHLNNISSLLPKMTSHGLCCLADLVTEGTVKYEKTRWRMKKIISEYLPTFLSETNNNFQTREEKITNLLKDPTYFRGGHAGLCSGGNLRHRCGSYGHLNNISSLLPKMTSHGLCCLADLVTEGTVKYEKTRWRMKKIISEYLPTFLSETNNNFQTREEKITNLLKDPTYFRGGHAGLCSGGNLRHRCGSYGHLNNISSLLPKMTSHGLCCLADLVTEGTVKYEKTRWRMKKIISEYLPTFLSETNNNFQTREEKITNLLKDPTYFRGGHAGLCSPAEAFRAAAIEVLNRLEQFPSQALSAMHRKLKGKKGYLPNLVHRKSSSKRDLIGSVRKCCKKMLFELDKTGEPQEPLTKALGVASITLKLILGCPSVIELQNFTPEVEALQNRIAKAIGLVNSEKNVSLEKLEALCKKLHTYPDGNFKFSKRGLRSAVRHLLIEYLLECSDMDVIPDCLLEALSEISTNRYLFQSSLKEKIEEEVECLLCLSAQIKQIVWDLHPELEVDLDFSDDYMEGIADSDDDDDDEEVELSNNCKFHLCDSIGLIEGRDETNSNASPNSMLNIKLETVDISERDAIQSHNFSHYSSSPESKILIQRQHFNGDKCHSEGWARSIWPDLEALGEQANLNQCEFSYTPSGLEGEGGPEVKRQQAMHKTTENLELLDSGLQSGGIGNFHPKQCTTGNLYLSIQKACDETTMAMYSIIGSMLNEFAQAEHLDLTPGDI